MKQILSDLVGCPLDLVEFISYLISMSLVAPNREINSSDCIKKTTMTNRITVKFA